MGPWIAFLLGFVVGSIVTAVIFRLKQPCGELKIDRSNPQKDIYRFDVGDLDKLAGKKRIVLKVNNEADLSQK